MTIKEVEEKTGLARSNIRFYEREHLIEPERTESGYRNYSDIDVEKIKKIAYMRTLGITIVDIRDVLNNEVPLIQIIRKQYTQLQKQISDLNNARHMCKKMLQNEDISIETLDISLYVNDLSEYWDNNKNTFELDSVSFFFLWGKVITWSVLTIGCLIIALFSYPDLPRMIPIQWNQGEVSSTVHKAFIFSYPTACIVVRFMLRPCIWRMLWKHGLCNDAITDFVVNFICLLTLSIEVFTVLYLLELVKNVAVLISAETIVFAFILILAWKKQKGILFSS